VSDNKNQLRAVDFNKLWLDKAIDEVVVEKVERPLPWPEPPERGPYRTALPCALMNAMETRGPKFVEDLDRAITKAERGDA
jgi:hypothetical protein